MTEENRQPSCAEVEERMADILDGLSLIHISEPTRPY